MKKEMRLRMVRLIGGTGNVRWPEDERRRCDRFIVEYIGDDGHEYRKAFHTQPGVLPKVPTEGTHKELNGLSNQVTQIIDAPDGA